MEFSIKRGDTSPSIKLRLTPAINLVGATVAFNVVGHDDGINIDRAVAGFDNSASPMSSTLFYDWQEADTAAIDTYANAEFEVTYADGTVETFPRTDFVVVKVTKDLG
tara:strand:- start:4 stop:327 length:324 start_codon:yes stop_codon:yes gene_type:complete